jgi:selenocysteine lyase/cysteine desulfurase
MLGRKRTLVLAAKQYRTFSAASLDVSFARSQFGAFREPSLAGQIHAENAGGTFACDQVIKQLNTFYRETKVQPYYLFDASVRGGQQMDAAYASMASYLNANEEDVSFGPSTSCNTYVLSQAIREGLVPGDEIIVTNQDHETNTGVWRRLEESGAKVREWQVNKDGLLDVADLEQLLSSKTKLLAFPHCSNVVAHVNPVAEIAAKAHEAGALVVCDGVSYCGHGLPDTKALGADVYMFSTYKTYGPHQGVMVVQPDALDKLPSQCHHFNAYDPQKRYTPAGPDHAQIAACHGIGEYFDTLCNHHFGEVNGTTDTSTDTQQRTQQLRDLFHGQEVALMTPLLSFLRERQELGHLRIIGPSTPEGRAPTIAFLPLPGAPRTKEVVILAQELADRGVGVGYGGFYANRLLESMGIDPDTGVVRVSLVHYNTVEEVEQVIAHLDELL